MKKAIGYIRISDKDQSNFSLEGQDRYIRDFCTRNNYQLTELFVDDGKSAKNFDRPDWQKLEHFIMKNKNQVDFLVVVKYDRFSRHAADGLNKIETLEHKHGILILSVFEQMLIDHNSPFFFKQRADILVNAEFELRVIRDRTKFGIHEAKLKGRYISSAPFGYVNKRDQDDKPIIEVDFDKIGIVKNIFNQYLNGVPLAEISKNAKEQGFARSGNSAIFRILGNCTYAGLVHVPAYRDQPEKYVKGLHSGIINEADWMEIQYKLGNIKQPKQILNDEAPLRSVLKCNCGKVLTGAKSKGKNKYYWYYKCNEHTRNNYSANKLHGQFDEILAQLSLSPNQIEYLINAVKIELQDQIQERTQNLTSRRIDLKKQLSQRELLEEKFINNQINQETYDKWHSTYSHNIYQLKNQINTLEGNSNDIIKMVEQELPKLGDLRYLYHKASLLQKQMFVRMVFNSKLYYLDGHYRTPEILPMFISNALIMNEKSPLIFDQEALLLGDSPVCTPDGT